MPKAKNLLALFIAAAMAFTALGGVFSEGTARGVSGGAEALTVKIDELAPTPAPERIEEPVPCRDEAAYAANEPKREIYSGTCGADGDNLLWTLDTETGVLTITGTGDMADYCYDQWQEYGQYIESVVIAQGATSIGTSAFYRCHYIKSVAIPGTVTCIGREAFCECSLLESVVIPYGVEYIDEYAFWKCSSLHLISIPNSVTNIESYAFSRTGLESVVIPDSVTVLGPHAFEHCVYLSSVSLPRDITEIGERAFSECRALGSIELPDGVTSIGFSAFQDCSALTSIYLPDSITTIAQRAFQGCTSLQSITIPRHVRIIDKCVFFCCTSLGSVSLPQGMWTIGDEAFSYCGSLADIDLPDSVSTIGDESFCGCNSLTEVNISANVSYFGDNAFGGCSSLEAIIVDPENEDYCSEDGIVFNKDKTTLVCFPAGKQTQTYSIPDGVTKIGCCAFAGCTGLTSVAIPFGVTEIADSAFSWCSAMTAIHIPGSVSSIGDFAFNNCTALTDVIIDEGLTDIGGDAFDECSSLSHITLPDSFETGGSYMFWKCSSLTCVLFLGPPPQIFYSTSLYECDPECCLYYTAVYAKQWTRSGNQWQGMPIRLFGGGSHAMSATSAYICVYDRETLLPLTDAEVTIYPDDKSEVLELTTGAGGLCCIIAPVFDSCSVVISRAGYETAHIDSVAVRLGKTALFSLAKKNDPAGVAGAYLVETVETGSGETDNMRDIIFEQIKIPSNSEDDIVIKVEAAEPGSVTAYELLCSGRVIGRNDTGYFEFDPSDIDSGVPVWLRLFKNGSALPAVKLQLLTLNIPTQMPSSCEVSLLDGGIDVEVPEYVPLIGGKHIKFDIGDLPVAISCKDDVIKAGIGVSLSFDPSDWSAFEELKLATLADDFDVAESALNNALASGASDWADTLGFDPKLKVFGFIEGKLGNAEAVSGYLRVTMSLEAEMEKQILAFDVIPIVLKLEAELAEDLTAGVKCYFDPFDLRLKGRIELTDPRLRPTTGIGIVEIIDVSCYGEMTNVITLDTETGYRGLRLDGEIGLSRKFLLYEEIWPIWGDSWTYYESYAKSDPTGFKKADEISCGTLRIAPRDHLKERSRWLGGEAVRDALTARQTVTLRENIWGGAKPQIASANGRTVMAWLDDDGTRTTGNNSMLVYSVQNADGSWTEPQPVFDDGTGDFYPCLTTDGEDIYIAWMDANAVFDESVTPAQLAAACEISAAAFGETENGFGIVSARRLTSNGRLDTMPCIAFENGGAYIAWVSNDACDILTMSGTNRIMACAFDGTPEELCAVASPVTELAAGRLAGSARFCWCADTDGDVSTLDDRRLRLCGIDGNETALSNDTCDSAPVFAKVNGTEKLFFSREGRLTSFDGTEFADEGMEVNGFDIVSGGTNAYLVQTVCSGHDAQIRICGYSGGEWKNAVTLTDTEGYAETPKAAVNADGGLTAVYVRTDAEITEDDIITSSDLCLVTMVPSRNITLEAVGFDKETVLPGALLPVTLTVTNSGELDISEATVTVTAPDGGQQSFVIACDIPSGDTAELNIDYALPTTASAEGFAFAVAVSEDFDASDNSIEETLFYADLSIELNKIASGGRQGVLAVIANESDITTNAVVRIRRNTTDGEVLCEFTLWSLEPHTLNTALVNGTRLREMMQDSECLVFTVESGVPEYRTGDNDAFIIVYEADFAEFIEQQEPTLVPGDVDGDGQVTFLDISTLYLFLTGEGSIDEEYLPNADFNGDGTATYADITDMYLMLLG